MHVISKKRLREFWERYAKAEMPLKAWLEKQPRPIGTSFHDVKEMFPQTDQYKGLVIFDIGGNKYRLIAEINYARGKVFIRQMLTHAEYDRGDWKDG